MKMKVKAFGEYPDFYTIEFKQENDKGDIFIDRNALSDQEDEIIHKALDIFNETDCLMVEQ